MKKYYTCSLANSYVVLLQYLINGVVIFGHKDWRYKKIKGGLYKLKLLKFNNTRFCFSNYINKKN